MAGQQKILVIKLRAIGDTVIWTSALRSLRTAYPHAEIHSLTYAMNSAVLENNPCVDARHELKSKSAWELLRKLWSLRAQKFEWLLGFHATTSLCRWAWLTSARKIALHHHSWKFTPRGSIEVPFAGDLEDVITRDHRILRAMDINSPYPPVEIFVTEGESRAAEALMRFEISRAGGDPDLPRYLFLPGGSYSLKRYPKDQWLPLAEKMKKEKRFQPVVLADRALSEELGLAGDCERRGLPLLDKGNLREFIALVSRGTRSLSNDSAPGHIAVALGLKNSFVFGPGCVGDFHPYDRAKYPLFRIAVACRVKGPRENEAFQYCTVTECSHHRCMRELHFEC